MPSRELRTYLGPVDRSVYGALHLPPTRVVTGTVLLVPPLAEERTDALRGLRRLADELAGRGLAVLRFDYYGTGDSADEPGRPDAVAAWADSTRIAADYLRGFGAGEPAVVALRAGALVAAEAGLAPPALVLWDAVFRGRTFTRQQAALAALALDAPTGEELEPHTWLGLTIAPAAVRDLSALTAYSLTSPRTLVAARVGAEQPVDGAMRITVDGMEEFLSPADHLVRLPDRAIDDIAQWLADAAPRCEPVTVIPEIRTEARFETAEGSVLERIESLGEAAAIRSLPAAGDPPARSITLCATANDTRHGPNGLWVTVARGAAASGAQAVRFDRRGAGESGPVTPGEVIPLFPDTAVEDALAAAASCGPAPLLAAGICSGSWYAAHIARDRPADAAVLVNSVLYSWRIKPALARPTAPGGTPADLGVPRSDPAFARTPRGRGKDLLRRRLPYRSWERLGERGTTQVPGVLLGPVAEAGARATVVLAPEDAAWFDAQRGPEGVALLTGAPAPPRIVRLDTGDHAGYHPDVRAAASAAILHWCRQR
ncbi:hypothetical protein [Tsukamurella sp. 1534]|uniref:hypothetical protein n=1 Tax=Tsukamurella sp. 1534 TaxID=1151061 RepID=UPI0003145A27|nr:hypothetical protein [Tsukamurella sp. 1534]